MQVFLLFGFIFIYLFYIHLLLGGILIYLQIDEELDIKYTRIFSWKTRNRILKFILGVLSISKVIIE